MMATQAIDTERRTRPGKFVWFEHASNDPKKAQKFYAEVIGWKVLPWGDGAYEMIQAGDTPETMIGGYTELKGGPRAHWISYVSVDDVDAAARDAAANGGRVIEQPYDIPEVGRTARIADPQGAELYLFKSASGDGPDAPGNAGPPPRRFFWNELHTTDPVKALSFYERLLGYTHKVMDMGPDGNYYVLSSKDGVGRSGLMGPVAKAAEVPPHWLPYVSVDDTDATLERVKKYGGKVHHGPEDIPGIGRFGVLEDPTGAFLAIMKAIPPQGA
jgi:predicted enzyme related to lactoylglutathione lyase